MKKLYFYLLSVFCICTVTVLPSQAQFLKQTGKVVVEGTTKTAVSKGVSQIPSATVTAAKAAKQASAALSSNVAASTKPYNNWVTNRKQTLYKLQRAVGISPLQAGRNLRKMGAAPTVKQPLPKPQGDSFLAQDLSSLIPQGKIVDYPKIPVLSHQRLIFRGMALKESAIKNVLENGMLVKDVSTESRALSLSYAPTNPRAMSYLSTHPVNNLTDSPDAAANWASKRWQEGSTLVVVSVKSEASGDIIVVENDILPDQFHDVMALLQLNGNPTWCKVELADNGYKITPYLK